MEGKSLMDIAYEMAQYLDDAGFGTLGTDIFVGQIPAEQDGIYIVRASGALNTYVPIESTLLDIYIKDTSASTAITNLESIKRYVHRMYDTQTANSNIYSILVLGDVDDVSRDLEYNKVFKISVQVMCRDNNLIS